MTKTEIKSRILQLAKTYDIESSMEALRESLERVPNPEYRVGAISMEIASLDYRLSVPDLTPLQLKYMIIGIEAGLRDVRGSIDRFTQELAEHLTK